jgi:hypothetical protein
MGDGNRLWHIHVPHIFLMHFDTKLVGFGVVEF